MGVVAPTHKLKLEKMGVAGGSLLLRPTAFIPVEKRNFDIIYSTQKYKIF